MYNKILEIRGIHRKELITYLIQLGGNSDDNELYLGDNWACHLDTEEYFNMFQSSIPKVKLHFSSPNEETLSTVIASFRKKTFRAGG